MVEENLTSCYLCFWTSSFLGFYLNFIWNRSLLYRAHLSQPMWKVKLLAVPPPHSLSVFISSHHFSPNICWPIYSMCMREGKMWKTKHSKKQREREKKKKVREADREDQVEHLIHRKWTEPHKASFLCELAVVGGAAVEKALLIWIKQGLLFKIPLLWVSQVSRPKPLFLLEVSVCSISC